MAKQSTSNRKQRSQGGGRTANSEPRLQLFRDFGGCNFNLSPREFDIEYHEDRDEQSDLQMNFVVVQNNVVTTEKTMETRNNLRHLFHAPSGKIFTDANILIGGEFYIADSNGDIWHSQLSQNTVTMSQKVSFGRSEAHNWESFAYYDNKIIGATRQNKLWDGTVGTNTMDCATYIEKPTALTLDSLTPVGDLKIKSQMEDDCVFRIGVAITYVNKYGPTEHSNQLSFYANYPTDEWHSGRYLIINGIAPTGEGIKAVELYYNVDNISELRFTERTDSIGSNGKWSISWIANIDSTSMWLMADLKAPTENFTLGAPASRITCIDGRLYFWGDSDHPERLYIGGNPGSLFSTSGATGGGFVDVEPGTHQEIRYVAKYKTQSGNNIVTMLCDSPNSTKEQRYNLVENTISLSSDQSMNSWQAEQVSGAVGCKSYKGAQVCEDGLYSVSRYGLALTTMTMEYNSQIRANYVSDPIKPIFTDPKGIDLKNSILLEADGILYLAMGSHPGKIDNILFCYDINAKAWWTITLDVSDPIIDLVHIDYEGFQEGIGIITEHDVYMLPTTQCDDPDDKANFYVLVETGELSTTIPVQGMHHVTQLEFDFDHFIGDLTIDFIAIDQFGRHIKVTKKISYDQAQYGLTEYMRIDTKVRSYKLIFYGKANFRITHFIAKVYVMSNKIGIVWGFDDKQSFRSDGDIHPTFKSYNDIRKAIIP